MKAKPLSKYKGKRFYRFPVKVNLNNSMDSDTWLNPPTLKFSVIAEKPEDAANLIRDEFKTRPQTEIHAYGVKGGETYRYVGYDSAVFNSMMAVRPREEQMRLL